MRGWQQSDCRKRVSLYDSAAGLLLKPEWGLLRPFGWMSTWLDLFYFLHCIHFLCMLREIKGIGHILLPSFPPLPIHVACCCFWCYRRSAAERLCPGRREGDWAAQCCRSPWQSPGTLSRSMACAYWLNGAGGEREETEEGFGSIGAIRKEQTCLFLTLHYGRGHGEGVHEWKMYAHVCANTKTQLNHTGSLTHSPTFSTQTLFPAPLCAPL